MKDSQYINIQGWMGKHLGLRANDLICFAVIYGFSMDGESQFKGNLKYLSACMFASQPTVLLALNKLQECNLILKQDDVVKGKKRCYYSTNVIYDEGNFTVMDSTKEPLVMTTKEPLVVTAKESLAKEYNNKEYNKEKDLSKAKSKKGGASLTPEEQEKEDKFRKAMRERYPRFMMMENPLTYKQSQELKKDYEDDEILQALEEIECWKPLLKKRVDAFRTIKNWINKNRERA